MSVEGGDHGEYQPPPKLRLAKHGENKYVYSVLRGKHKEINEFLEL
jgi:hypothetical protein